MSADPEVLPEILPEALQAFIEGSLAAGEAIHISARIADDPEFALYVEDQKRLWRLLRSPAAMWVRSLSGRISRQGDSLVMAAALAGGIALGVTLAASYGMGTDYVGSNGMLVVKAELGQALSAALPSEDSARAGAAARVGASFWSRTGSFCRSFMTRETGGSALAGIACRENGAWRINAIQSVAPIDSGGSALEMSQFPPSIRNALENLMVGEPLSADAERQARSQGWRPR